MPSVRLGLFFLFLLLITRSTAQQQDTLYSDINDALKNPEKVVYLSLDCDENDDSLFYDNISKFKNLEVFSISNSKRKDLSVKISALKNLQRLYITSCTNINFQKLFNQLTGLSSLKTLSINDCELKECPREIQKLKSLQSLIITDNDEFDTELLVKLVSKLPKLQKLALPINQITDLPENIATLKQIEVLDLSNNWLTELPNEISEMKSLENLDLSGNIIISPLSALGKLKDLNIRYLNMDKGLSAGDKDKLAKLFPNALITENTTDPLDDNDTTGFNLPVADSTLAAKTLVKDTSGKPQDDTLHYGTFSIQKDQFRILSPAYLYYANLFNARQFASTFDSTLFDQRYLDTTYINVRKRLRRNLTGEITIGKIKGSHRQIWFSFFYPKSICDPYINKNNNELNAFKGMVWVYTGKMKKHEFAKTFIRKLNRKNAIKFWKKGALTRWRICWNDVRIYYDQGNKNFTIEFKDGHGFKKISAYPRLPDNKSSSEIWQRQYTKRYARYLSLLNKRRMKFYKNLFKEKALYDASLRKSKETTWAAFQKLYFSDEEKKLSMNQWLEYYDLVIANEKRALYNADASIDNLSLYMNRENYQLSTFSKIVPGDTSMQAMNISFKDEEQNLLVVSKILLVNQADKTYCSYNGSLGLEPMLMYLSLNKPLSIVVELRNGDMGVLTKEKYANEKLTGMSQYTFTLQRITKKLGSVGQITDMLNL